MQALFRRARAAAPTIIFFDEVDALACKRGGGGEGGAGATERVLTQVNGYSHGTYTQSTCVSERHVLSFADKRTERGYRATYPFMTHKTFLCPCAGFSNLSATDGT